MGDQERGAGASGPCRGLGQRPKTCAAAQPRKRCERPKAARNAARSSRIVFPIRPHRSFRCPRKYRRSVRWPRAALVFAHAFRSLCRLRWQVPTGHTLPFGPPSGRFAAFCGNSPPGWRFPPRHRAGASLRCPKTCAAAQPRKRCERPKAARNAAHSTRIVFAPAIRGHRGIIPPAAHLFAPLRQGLPSCAPKSAIKPYQQRSQSP